MEYFEVFSSTPGFPVPVRGVLVLSCLRIFEGLGGFCEAGVGSGASDAASGAGHSFDHAVFDLAGFCQSEDFFAFGKAFCVFDVDWYIGIVFLQTVFDGSSYAAGDGVASPAAVAAWVSSGSSRRWMG